jgi:cell division septal protein FtsQ
LPPRLRRKLSTILIFLVVATFLALGMKFLSSDYFAINSVEVKDDSQGKVTAAIKEALLGKNLIFLGDDTTKGVLATNLSVLKVSLEKIFPNKVIAKVTWRTPLLSFQSKYGRYLIDQSGLAYAPSSGEKLPEVSNASSNLRLGDRLPSEQVNLIVKIIAAIEKNYTVLTIRFQDDFLEVNLASGTRVIVPLQGDLDQEQNALQLLLSQAKIEGKLPKVVDLRPLKTGRHILTTY